MFVFVQCAVLILGLTLFRPSHTNAQPPQQYSIMDKVAAKIIAKYQNSTCNDLYQQKAQKTPPSPEEKRLLNFFTTIPKCALHSSTRLQPPSPINCSSAD
jgi:hypothetical protein